MPAPTTAAAFLDWLEANHLLSAEQAHELRPLLPTFADPRALARELLGRDWLTAYQVNQVLQGKGDQLVLGVFRLRERLGEGAMGQVFKAWNTRLARVMAVKTLHKDLVDNARAMDRFRQEIQTAAQLDHPNIVKVRDAEELDGRPFLVMEFIDGADLATIVKARGPLPVPLAAECARQAALGLQHAYERGVIHRDIKPANLLVQGALASGAADAPSGDLCVKILDFGLARLDSDRAYPGRLTQIGRTLGTVDYMAPEQAESARDADTRADIYGLGCTLFYLLTGRPPFSGSSLADKLAARVNGLVPDVRDARPGVPDGLAQVLRRMMARQPADRYQTPAEVAAALAPYTGAAPAEGGVPPAPAVPRMELDEPIPLAAPVSVDAATPVPLATPVHAGATPDLPPPPAREGRFPLDDAPNPFALSGGDAAAPAPAASPAAASRGPAQRPARPGGVSRLRLAVGIGAAAAVLFILLLSCGGYLIVSWLRGGPRADAWPAGAEIQIPEAFVSSDVLPIGSRKNVIVKVRRVKFDGPVSVHLEDLPSGVTSAPVTIKSGTTAVEVPITASFGIDPVTRDIRIVATSKNLTAERALTLQVVPDRFKKNLQRGP